MPTEPPWKQNLAKAAGKSTGAASVAGRQRWKTIEEAMYNSLDRYGAEMFFDERIRKSPDRFMQFLGSRMPTEHHAEVNAALTVIVKTQLGETIPVRLTNGFALADGRRLPRVPHTTNVAPEDVEVIEPEGTP